MKRIIGFGLAMLIAFMAAGCSYGVIESDMTLPAAATGAAGAAEAEEAAQPPAQTPEEAAAIQRELDAMLTPGTLTEASRYLSTALTPPEGFVVAMYGAADGDSSGEDVNGAADTAGADDAAGDTDAANAADTAGASSSNAADGAADAAPADDAASATDTTNTAVMTGALVIMPRVTTHRDIAGVAESRGTLLTQGSKGEEVKAAQQTLKIWGFLAGAADGVFGGGTAKAAEAFQEYVGHEPTGVIGGTTQRMLEGGLPKMQAAEGALATQDAMRVQRRLKDLRYYQGNIDGVLGGGSKKALTDMQKQNKLTQSGAADSKTLGKLFSGDAKANPIPGHKYLLKISVDKQRVYAYTYDAEGKYTQLVRTMICSTGLPETPTPKGTFKSAGPVARWGYFTKFKVWAQYWFRISGPYLFHSVLYTKQDTSTLLGGSVAKLGSRASHGCVRLKVEDAKWIYENCSAGTTVTVY